jgi:hypothetical protein
LPVFAAGISGGWSSLLLLGWALLFAFWAAIWWAFASFIVRYMFKHGSK